jgi:hypothetical protein
MTRTMSPLPEKATFGRLVNSRFRLHADEQTSVEVELVEFREESSVPSIEQFSLVFRAPADAPAEQRIYGLEHDETGPFELFLVPLGRDGEDLLYEAVFNRRVEPGEV